MQEYQTVSACTRTPSCNQITSYLIVIILTLAYYAAIVPKLHPPLQLPLALIYGIVLSSVAVTTLRSSSIDPADSIMIAFRKGARTAISSSLPDCLYCESCRSYVRNSSRHCKLCNRCVEGFDHHCIWINNCIGQSNYAWFVAMVTSVCSLFVLFILSVPLLHNQQQPTDPVMVLLWVLEGFAILTFIPLIVLLSFHIYLYCHQMTTYDFFTLNRKKDKKEKTVKQTLPAHPNLWEQPSEVLQVRAGGAQIQEQNPQMITLESLRDKNEGKIKDQGKKQRPKSSNIIVGYGNKVMPTEAQESQVPSQLNAPLSIKSRLRSFSMKLLFGSGLQVQRFQTPSNKYFHGEISKINSESSSELKGLPK